MSKSGEIVVTLPGGRRVDAELGGHVIHTDQPPELGGDGTAPTPFSLFLASMGTCAGIFVQGFCAKRGIPFDGIRIIERPELDANGVLKGVDFEIELPPGFPEKYREAVVRVAEQCSVKRAIQEQPELRVHATPLA